MHLKALLNPCRDVNYSHKLLMGDFNFKEINWCEMTTSVNENQSFYQHVLEP